MKLAFYILTVVLALLAVRLTNDAADIVWAMVCVGLAILCFWGALISGSIEDNRDLK